MPVITRASASSLAALNPITSGVTYIQINQDEYTSIYNWENKRVARHSSRTRRRKITLAVSRALAAWVHSKIVMLGFGRREENGGRANEKNSDKENERNQFATRHMAVAYSFCFKMSTDWKEKKERQKFVLKWIRWQLYAVLS